MERCCCSARGCRKALKRFPQLFVLLFTAEYVLPKGEIKEDDKKTAGKSPETILHRMGGFLSLTLGMRQRMPHRCHDEKSMHTTKISVRTVSGTGEGVHWKHQKPPNLVYCMV
jgi:hypothetical protein